MSAENPIMLGAYQVQLEQVYLLHARYLDTESPRLTEAPEIADEFPINLSMAFDRPAWNRLTVAISVDLAMTRPFRIEVSYAGVFVLQRGVRRKQADDALRRAAAEVAPLVIYPYIRETITNLTQRGRAGGLAIPILGFDPLQAESVEIPPPPAPARAAAAARRGRAPQDAPPKAAGKR